MQRFSTLLCSMFSDKISNNFNCLESARCRHKVDCQFKKLLFYLFCHFFAALLQSNPRNTERHTLERREMQMILLKAFFVLCK